MNILVEKQSQAFSAEEITINAPIEVTWEVLSDISGWPKWQKEVRETEVFGKISEGTRFIWKAGGMKITSQLHTVTPVIEFGWTGRMGWIKAVHNWYFERWGNGTKVRTEESFRGIGSFLMKSMLKNGMKKNLAELKSYVESKFGKEKAEFSSVMKNR